MFFQPDVQADSATVSLQVTA